MNQMVKQLVKHEGFRGKYYKCTSDKLTIGIGRNVEAKPFSCNELDYLGGADFDTIPMSKAQALWLLYNDLDVCLAQLLDSGVIQGYSRLNEARKAVIVNMIYNMGITGFSKFKNTIIAINAGDFDTAAVEMLDSRWAAQVGFRAVELSNQMMTGEFQ